MASPDQDLADFDLAAQRVVDLGNRLLDEDAQADEWEVASGLLAGAVQFWLFSRQPCGDPLCEECSEISTAELRMHKLIEELKLSAEESDYYHSPSDSNVGRA